MPRFPLQSFPAAETVGSFPALSKEARKNRIRRLAWELSDALNELEGRFLSVVIHASKRQKHPVLFYDSGIAESLDAGK